MIPLRIIDAIAPQCPGDCCYAVISCPARMLTKRVSLQKFRQIQRGLQLRKCIDILMYSGGLDKERAREAMPAAERLAEQLSAVGRPSSVEDVVRMMARLSIKAPQASRCEQMSGYLSSRRPPPQPERGFTPIGTLALRLAAYLFSEWRAHA